MEERTEVKVLRTAADFQQALEVTKADWLKSIETFKTVRQAWINGTESAIDMLMAKNEMLNLMSRINHIEHVLSMMED